MPTVIVKKTFKVKPSGFQVANEKSFSFHGAIPQVCIDEVNALLRSVKFAKNANTPQFKMDATGHYYASMNHDCQKHNEEDIVVAVFDAMERMGWTFRFQYDSESSSVKMSGSSATSRELFIFHKP
jgi:hypothetical protein